MRENSFIANHSFWLMKLMLERAVRSRNFAWNSYTHHLIALETLIHSKQKSVFYILSKMTAWWQYMHFLSCVFISFWFKQITNNTDGHAKSQSHKEYEIPANDIWLYSQSVQLQLCFTTCSKPASFHDNVKPDCMLLQSWFSAILDQQEICTKQHIRSCKSDVKQTQPTNRNNKHFRIGNIWILTLKI